MTSFKLIDRENRHLNYLRVSITDRCNLKCMYCTPNGFFSKLEHNDILTYEEILRVVKIGVSLGIRKVRITGGEPLVRKGVYDFINRLSNINGLTDLSITTNGVLLLRNARKIQDAGIKRINVSLDSLKSEKYQYITNCNKFKRVWDGILYAYKIGFNPIKINIVTMMGLNDDEICDFARLSFKYPFHIRFIEYMPMGISQIRPKNQILTPSIKEKLSTIGKLNFVENNKNDGPARRFKFSGAIGELGFISAISNHFCDKCNRLRLTADGELRSCLLSDFSFPLKSLIRNGCSDYDIANIFINSARHKGVGHHLTPNIEGNVKGNMYSIGG